LAPAVFLPILSNAISIKGTALLWYYRLHNEYDGRAEEDFTKWIPGMFLALLKITGKSL
jgi:hypothetical protein